MIPDTDNTMPKLLSIQKIPLGTEQGILDTNVGKQCFIFFANYRWVQ